MRSPCICTRAGAAPTARAGKQSNPADRFVGSECESRRGQYDKARIRLGHDASPQEQRRAPTAVHPSTSPGTTTSRQAPGNAAHHCRCRERPGRRSTPKCMEEEDRRQRKGNAENAPARFPRSERSTPPQHIPPRNISTLWSATLPAPPLEEDWLEMRSPCTCTRAGQRQRREQESNPTADRSVGSECESRRGQYERGPALYLVIMQAPRDSADTHSRPSIHITRNHNIKASAGTSHITVVADTVNPGLSSRSSADSQGVRQQRPDSRNVAITAATAASINPRCRTHSRVEPSSIHPAM